MADETDETDEYLRELQQILMEQIGKRGAGGKQAPTSALCWASHFPKQLIGATQKGPFKIKEIPGYDSIIDGRSPECIQTTICNVTQWTGYHAEMITLAALLFKHRIIEKLNTAKGDKNPDYSACQTELKNTCGEVYIAANAPCCKHCHNLLTKLGVKHSPVEGAPGNTGWWNPLNDTVYENGSPAFQKDLPP
ncbi:hypothetical protein [Thalassomonas sp. RHCl1]|uniref:hypothetical protein n=1 Tax=Thalassomonas sp. RHCl1 TaxID=2995320 RepID=UPI00248B71F7|nr:hypothetical protein [Thalassomonas sp. RHCl1]